MIQITNALDITKGISDMYTVTRLNDAKTGFITYKNSRCFSLDVLASDVSLEELNNFLQNPYKKRIIQPGDKVYFCPKNKFPALLLKRLGINITRTIKLESANIAVLSSEPKHFFRTLEGSYTYHIYAIDQNNVGYSYMTSDQNDIKIFTKLLSKNFKIYYSIGLNTTVKNDYEFILKNPNVPCIDLYNFYKYIQTQTPSISDEDFENIYKMMLSSDTEAAKTAIEMLPYYNVQTEDQRFGIISAYIIAKYKYDDNRFKSSIANYVISTISQIPLENFFSKNLQIRIHNHITSLRVFLLLEPLLNFTIDSKTKNKYLYSFVTESFPHFSDFNFISKPDSVSYIEYVDNLTTIYNYTIKYACMYLNLMIDKK